MLAEYRSPVGKLQCGGLLVTLPAVSWRHGSGFDLTGGWGRGTSNVTTESSQQRVSAHRRCNDVGNMM
jgi:hypothetical protein